MSNGVRGKLRDQQEVPSMLCHSCHSENVREYSAEINIHFPGMKGLNIPTVWIFPRILVCMDCGETRFEIPESERKELAERDYRGFVGGVVI